MTELAAEPPELDDELLPEAYEVQDNLVFHTPGRPAEWIESDLTVTPEDAGPVETDHWETARDELGER